MNLKELYTYAENTWCPGCGDFAIEKMFKQGVLELEEEGKLERHNVVILSGIGCHGKISDYTNLNSFYSLHGRVVAPATGIKLVNPELFVIGFAGDGDTYGEGLEHLIFAAKRNIDITMIVHNNHVYGLTTGQFTPTSPSGFKGKSTPQGSPERPLNPIEIMLASGASFVARAFAGDIKNLKEIIKQAIIHKGFSIVDVLQPCVTFYNTYSFYKEKVYNLQDEGHNSEDWNMAMNKAREWNYELKGEKIATGIFYKEQRETFENRILKGDNLSELPVPEISDLLLKSI